MPKKETKPDVQKVSDAEWKVMHVLWDRKMASASEVCEALAETFSWSPKTVRTFLARLVQKKVVGIVQKEGLNHYIPLIEEFPAKQMLGQSFLQKFFGGLLPSMVAHFVNDEKITLDELAQLQNMIEHRRAEMKNQGHRESGIGNRE